MQACECDIIILKPTRLFLSFLKTQLPDIELPSLRVLQTDNTAYVMAKQKNDEETLNEIERHFVAMFKHELRRSLEKPIANKIEGSFLDFLCCFKFELHSHILVWENSLAAGKNLLRIKPRTILLKWLKSALEDDVELTSVLEKVNLSHLADNATVVVKNFSNADEIKVFLRQYYRPILETEMLRMCDKTEDWLNVNSYQEFSDYFAVETHSQLIHLQ